MYTRPPIDDVLMNYYLDNMFVEHIHILHLYLYMLHDKSKKNIYNEMTNSNYALFVSIFPKYY